MWQAANAALDLFRTRRGWLVFAAILVCTYSISVLVYVESAPDLGLCSAFSSSLKTAPAPRMFRPAVPGVIPQNGDKVIKLGNLDIGTWPDLLAAPRLLHDQAAALDDSELATMGAKRELIDNEKVTLVRAIPA